MKLIKEVETNSSIKSMSIYKLDDEESKKYNAKFVLLGAVFSDEELQAAGIDNLLYDVKFNSDEGFFETEKEALLYANCVQLQIKLDRLIRSIIELNKFTKNMQYLHSYVKLRKCGDL